MKTEAGSRGDHRPRRRGEPDAPQRSRENDNGVHALVDHLQRLAGQDADWRGRSGVVDVVAPAAVAEAEDPRAPADPRRALERPQATRQGRQPRRPRGTGRRHAAAPGGRQPAAGRTLSWPLGASEPPGAPGAGRRVVAPPWHAPRAARDPLASASPSPCDSALVASRPPATSAANTSASPSTSPTHSTVAWRSLCGRPAGTRSPREAAMGARSPNRHPDVWGARVTTRQQTRTNQGFALTRT